MVQWLSLRCSGKASTASQGQTTVIMALKNATKEAVTPTQESMHWRQLTLILNGLCRDDETVLACQHKFAENRISKTGRPRDLISKRSRVDLQSGGPLTAGPITI